MLEKFSGPSPKPQRPCTNASLAPAFWTRPSDKRNAYPPDRPTRGHKRVRTRRCTRTRWRLLRLVRGAGSGPHACQRNGGARLWRASVAHDAGEIALGIDALQNAAAPMAAVLDHHPVAGAHLRPRLGAVAGTQDLRGKSNGRHKHTSTQAPPSLYRLQRVLNLRPRRANPAQIRFHTATTRPAVGRGAERNGAATVTPAQATAPTQPHNHANRQGAAHATCAMRARRARVQHRRPPSLRGQKLLGLCNLIGEADGHAPLSGKRQPRQWPAES